MVSEGEISACSKRLSDTSQPMNARFRALFALRNLGGKKSINAISSCFTDSSSLLKHELAYCLGQMGDATAIPVLSEVLADIKQEPMVRHEAGEALGAIGGEAALSIIEKFRNDPIIEVSETCELAYARIKWLQSQNERIPRIDSKKVDFTSVDPTPPSEETDLEILERTLLDEQLPLFDRYCAMFSLRNLNNQKSAIVLSKGFNAKSALFRHEIGFVLGQMCCGDSEVVKKLREVVENKEESEMVRHEAAEALGSIATKEANEVLHNHLHDDVRVLRESCEVALDISEYQKSSDFQYADGLTKLKDVDNK